MKDTVVNKHEINELPRAKSTPMYLSTTGKIMRSADDGLQIILI